jgi:hypothetical protein
MKTPVGIDGARVVIDVIMPTSADPKTYTLSALPLRKGAVLLNPGLTDDDWSDSAAHPTAWRLRLLAADGTEKLQGTRSYKGQEKLQGTGYLRTVNYLTLDT